MEVATRSSLGPVSWSGRTGVRLLVVAAPALTLWLSGLATAACHAHGATTPGTSWALVTVRCPSGQVAVGRGCWTERDAGWTASDGSARLTDTASNPPSYDATYTWSLPTTIAGSGGTASVSTTAHDISNGAGIATQICLSNGFSIKDNAASCASAYAETPGSTVNHTTRVTLLPHQASNGSTTTVDIGFGSGYVVYTYKASKAKTKKPPPKCRKRGRLAASIAHACAESGGIWDGVWLVGNGKDVFGKFTLHAKPGTKKVTGTYNYSGGGTVTATIFRTRVGADGGLEGNFTDKKHFFTGYFDVTLNSDGVSFDGYFKHCRSLVPCKHYKLHGEHQ